MHICYTQELASEICSVNEIASKMCAIHNEKKKVRKTKQSSFFFLWLNPDVRQIKTMAL